jgi:hypothetical protein
VLDRAKVAQWPSAAVADYQRMLPATGQAVPTGAARRGAALPDREDGVATRGPLLQDGHTVGAHVRVRKGSKQAVIGASGK